MGLAIAVEKTASFEGESLRTLQTATYDAEGSKISGAITRFSASGLVTDSVGYVPDYLEGPDASLNGRALAVTTGSGALALVARYGLSGMLDSLWNGSGTETAYGNDGAFLRPQAINPGDLSMSYVFGLKG